MDEKIKKNSFLIIKSKEQLIYEHPCWGHECNRYREAKVLNQEIDRTMEQYHNSKFPLPYPILLRELNLMPNTPEHWKECLPVNLKLLEKTKLYCEQTLFFSFKNEPKLMFEYWKLTHAPAKEVTEPTLSLSELGDDSSFS